MRLAVERRLVPLDGPMAVAALNGAAVLAALLLGGLLFLPFGADPVSGYADLVGEAFLSWRGLGFTLVQATPLVLVALGTVVAWRAGFAYLGFEGCLLVGAVAAAWLALLTGGALPGTLFFPLAVALTFAAGGAWAGLVGLLRARFGGNEVLISLMANYVAAYLVQYLVSGPMRAGATCRRPRCCRGPPGCRWWRTAAGRTGAWASPCWPPCWSGCCSSAPDPASS